MRYKTVDNRKIFHYAAFSHRPQTQRGQRKGRTGRTTHGNQELGKVQKGENRVQWGIPRKQGTMVGKWGRVRMTKKA